jgi:hypothetical protein
MTSLYNRHARREEQFHAELTKAQQEMYPKCDVCSAVMHWSYAADTFFCKAKHNEVLV